VHACTLAEAADWLAADPLRRKGEFVLIVEGAPETTVAEDAGQRALEALLGELPLRRAVDLAARITGGRKNELYKLALELKQREW
jgi:16S rRNA (cytidine1402-2'-O)-methyltransferase